MQVNVLRPWSTLCVFKRLAYLCISNNTLACFADHAKLAVFMESKQSLDESRGKKMLTEKEILELDGKQIKERLGVRALRAHVYFYGSTQWLCAALSLVSCTALRIASSSISHKQLNSSH